MDAKPIEFETKRLRLRQWRDSDYEPFAAMSADPAVMRYFPGVLTREESDALADEIRSLITTRGWGVWAAEVKDTSSFVGIVGLHVSHDSLPCSPCVEVLWRLAREHWGKGYASEAASAVLAFAFEELKLEEVVSFAVVENQRSRNVMERVGMRHEGEVFAHPQLPEDSPLSAHVLYRLRRESWVSRKGAPSSR